MSSIKLFPRWILLLLALLSAGIGNAWADRGGHFHGSIGVYVGPPYWNSWYYPPPYYYHPYPVIIERTPPVYIEQPAPAVSAAPENAYWYYCNASNAYYPYVKECPSGWQKVSPQPPTQP